MSIIGFNNKGLHKYRKIWGSISLDQGWRIKKQSQMSDWSKEAGKGSFQTSVIADWGRHLEAHHMGFQGLSQSSFALHLPSKSQESCSHWKIIIQNHIGKEILGNIFSRLRSGGGVKILLNWQDSISITPLEIWHLRWFLFITFSLKL